MFQSPYGDYLVRNMHELLANGHICMFQSPYGDYLVRNFGVRVGDRLSFDGMFQSPYGDYLVRNNW